MDITWLGHGTFLIGLPGGMNVVLDPWITGNPMYPVDFEIERVDLMLVTHGHFDHIHDAVPLATKFAPPVVGIFELCHWLERKGVAKTQAMNKGGTQRFFEGTGAALSVTMVHAVHSCGIMDGDQIIYGGEAAGYVLGLADGRSVYFSGDTNVFSDMALIRELYAPELAFLPIGDHFTMGPKEAAKAAELVGAQRVIPMHFGTFPVLKGSPVVLAGLLKPMGVEVWTLEPGQTVSW